MPNRKNFDQVLEDSKLVHREYFLCDFCLGRLFSKQLSLSSNKILGKKLHQKLPYKKSTKCYICKNLLDTIDFPYKKIVESIKDYEFSSFLIGSILKPSIIDHDDHIRSKFKLRGIDSVKSSITKEIAKKLSKKTKSVLEYQKPELTITVNFKKDSIELRSKSVILFGHYTKNSRDLPQKQKSCSNCSGKGCLQCDYHGISSFDSVEGKISKFLYNKFFANQVKISWIGGEDKSSLVTGKGRPFFVQVLNPKKREMKFPKKINLDEINIIGLNHIESLPRVPLTFRSKIELIIDTENEIQKNSLKKLKDIKKSPIAIYKDSNRNEKSIHSIKYKQTQPKSFILEIVADGGLPIKKFVDSDSVFPNLSDLLETKCKCRCFDFHEIIIQ